MLGLQQLHAQRKTTSSVPPSPPKPFSDPLLERMTRLPERKRVSGVWTLPKDDASAPAVKRVIFTYLNTAGAADVIIATSFLACRTRSMEDALEISFRSLGDSARKHLRGEMATLAKSAVRLVDADLGKVGLLREALAEAMRLGHYIETDIIMLGRDARFVTDYKGPLAGRMFLAASNILALEERNSRNITEDIFLTLDGVTSWMSADTCRMLLESIAAAHNKRIMLGVMQEARTYTNNENGLRRALASMKREATGPR